MSEESAGHGRAIERCEVCGGSTTNTALPVFDETLRVCDRCQRGLWRALEGKGGDNFDLIDRIEDSSDGDLTETIEAELEEMENGE